MKRDKDDYEHSKDVLDNFVLTNEGIDLTVQEEYVCFSGTIDFENVDYEQVLRESDKLFDKHTPVESKKRLLILLAHLGTPESCRILERYLKTSEGDFRDWALLSLKECRMLLESVLLDEETGLISTGLGGRGNKLRYFFIVGSKEGLPFSETHRNTIQRGFETAIEKYGAKIEEISFEAAYVAIGILIPMDVAVGEVIEEGISECNGTGELLFRHFYVTNVKRPTREEISEYLEELKHEEE